MDFQLPYTTKDPTGLLVESGYQRTVHSENQYPGFRSYLH